MRKRRWSRQTCIGAYLLASVCAGLAQDQHTVYPGVTVSASYAYDISGRTDRIKGFLIKVGDPQTLKNPGLVILATGIGSPGQALLKFNGKDYAVPSMEGDFSGRDGAARPARSGSAADVAGEDVIAKIVIPLKAADVTAGVNQAEFFRGPNSGAYGVLAAQIESVTQTAPAVMGQTHHLLSRNLPPKIRDFDAVYGLNPDERRRVEDTPAWGRQGLVNYYRSGMGPNLDRMSEMFAPAHINLVSVGIPRQRDSEAFRNTNALIDRYHAKGMKVASPNTLGGVALREVLSNPAAESWLAHDEYGNKIWMSNGSSFAADISSPSYRAYVLAHVETQIDAGADELYYDYGLGGTGDVRTLFEEMRAYFGFRAENQQLFAGVSTVSKIGVLAPPHVPSFEVALTRESLYNALSEMNIMHDILLLHRLTSAQMLSRYKAVIITDIPRMDAAQTAALEAYKRAGGRIYTIGSAKKFRDLSDVTMPAALFARLAEPPVRKELAESLRKLEGAPLVTIEDARYVAANLVRKNGQNRFILHLVNYDKPLKNVRVKVDFEGVADSIDSRSLRLYSPDSVSRTVNVTNSTGRILEFQVPELDVYDIITFN